MGNRNVTHRAYSAELKQEILDKHFKEGISSTVLSKEYNLPQSTIKNWAHKTSLGKNVLTDFRPLNSGKRKKDELYYKEKYELLKKMQNFVKQHREKKLYS